MFLSNHVDIIHSEYQITYTKRFRMNSKLLCVRTITWFWAFCLVCRSTLGDTINFNILELDWAGVVFNCKSLVKKKENYNIAQYLKGKIYKLQYIHYYVLVLLTQAISFVFQYFLHDCLSIVFIHIYIIINNHKNENQ